MNRRSITYGTVGENQKTHIPSMPPVEGRGAKAAMALLTLPVHRHRG